MSPSRSLTTRVRALEAARDLRGGVPVPWSDADQRGLEKLAALLGYDFARLSSDELDELCRLSGDDPTLSAEELSRREQLFELACVTHAYHHHEGRRCRPS